MTEHVALVLIRSEKESIDVKRNNKENHSVVEDEVASKSKVSLNE
jgi:hypothetical protein